MRFHHKHLPVTFALLGFLLIGCARGDWKIVAGQRVGEIHIGMTHVEVMRLLGTPSHEEDLKENPRNGTMLPGREPLPKLEDILQDDWITPLPVSLNPDSEDPLFMCTFITVYTSLKTGRVLQIEVCAPRFKTADNCSSESSALDLRRHYPRYRTTTCRYSHPSSGGIPAPKHFITFEDAIDDGIAWRYGATGALAPDPDPAGELETIIIHAAGEAALFDPDGGSRFIWKIVPARFGRD